MNYKSSLNVRKLNVRDQPVSNFLVSEWTVGLIDMSPRTLTSRHDLYTIDMSSENVSTLWSMVWRSCVSPFESAFPVLHIRDKTVDYLPTKAHRNAKMVSFERKYPKLVCSFFDTVLVWYWLKQPYQKCGGSISVFLTAGVLTPRPVCQPRAWCNAMKQLILHVLFLNAHLNN